MVRLGTDVLVGLAAAALVKSLGFKQGTVAAFVVVAVTHELLDAPVAAALEQTI